MLEAGNTIKSLLPRPGSVALVTGAAQGIGAATARYLAADGWHVIATDINREGLEKLKASVANPDMVDIHYLDVCDSKSVNDTVAEIIGSLSQPISLLVNNAGFASVSNLEEITDEHWDRVINLNLTSLMRVSRAVVPHMKEQGGGTIICMGSIAGHTFGWPGRLAYSSAKAGITGMVRTLAVELAPAGIRVNGIAPAGLHARAEQVPLGYVGTPDDIGSVVTLLASERFNFATGQMISVDGGMCVTF